MDFTRAEDSYLDDLEIRLRRCIEEFKAPILDLAVQESCSRESFVISVRQKIEETESIESYDSPSFIKLASIDVDVNEVHRLLLSISAQGKANEFFEQALRDYEISEVLSANGDTLDLAEKCMFVLTTHVTLAHCRNLSQALLRSSYQSFCYQKVNLAASCFMWSERVAAIGVLVPNSTATGLDLPQSLNTFTHITVWFQEGSTAVEANDLPKQWKSGNAKCVEFETEIPLQGTVSLWKM
jgi:hypothetical protein